MRRPDRRWPDCVFADVSLRPACRARQPYCSRVVDRLDEVEAGEVGIPLVAIDELFYRGYRS